MSSTIRFVFSRTFSRRGFTLIELMVSVGIIGVLSTMVAVNYPDTNTRLTLSNAASNLALQFREAQIRGSSVDTLGGAAAGYGLYFARNSPTSFIYFFDRVGGFPNAYGLFEGDKLYGGVDEIKNTVTLPKNFSIRNFCVGDTIATLQCTESSITLTSASVVFVRPNPQPIIYYNNSTGNPAGIACVEISTLSPNLAGHTRSVTIYSSGVIVHTSRPCN